MVSLRAPRELERYVFSPGGRSDSLVQAGGGEGLPEEYGWEGPEDADAAKDDMNDSGETHGPIVVTVKVLLKHETLKKQIPSWM